MFCCRYCPCCYYVVIIPGYYFLSFLFLLLLCCYHSWALILAVVVMVVLITSCQPSQCCCCSRTCLSLANKVDVVAHRLATRHVLPLAGVVPTVAHHNAVLGGVCCWVVAHPARIVTVRASIAPNPSALGS